ncbi:hypothetical protein [Spirochaeta isovalerica]|uniref:Uncharacterized protein n=1 Tax=Spirochaeta isovalerica TaxID=150 RepID=A0A841R7T4_9SPIO|nr:hypothetical protein [Spirochaeta isovalerica]MBB6479886.1 hypothetical protein [Spirochaeta isovalerica]
MNKKRKEQIAVFLIRWWSIGAIYFLIGWGTPLGRYNSLIDLIFFLGIAIGLASTFFINPTLHMLYGIGWHRPYGSSTFAQRFVCRAKDITLGFISAIFIMAIYQGINSAAVAFFGYPSDEVFLPGEPILFGLFYALIMQLILLIISLFKKKDAGN